MAITRCDRLLGAGGLSVLAGVSGYLIARKAIGYTYTSAGLGLTISAAVMAGYVRLAVTRKNDTEMAIRGLIQAVNRELATQVAVLNEQLKGSDGRRPAPEKVVFVPSADVDPDDPGSALGGLEYEEEAEAGTVTRKAAGILITVGDVRSESLAAIIEWDTQTLVPIHASDPALERYDKYAAPWETKGLTCLPQHLRGEVICLVLGTRDGPRKHYLTKQQLRKLTQDGFNRMIESKLGL